MPAEFIGMRGADAALKPPGPCSSSWPSGRPGSTECQFL